ncbi:hypothetical protein TNCV_3192491 [Trichonephila clavipes]|nr:hypothetical protein TNCV_3192491 [Trichonephila clavipes]
MTPIEHVGYLVGRRLARDPRPAASKDELLLCIQAIWNFLPQADYWSSNDMVCEREIPFGPPFTSKVQSISLFGDQRSVPLLSISLHPASGGRGSLMGQGVAGEVQGGPRNNIKVLAQMQV